MAASKKATPKTGVTPFPLQDEKANQKRVPPRGKTKRADEDHLPVGDFIIRTAPN
jgi:hypothetical protein